MQIVIKTIPHQDQRYDTCGDWWYEDDGSLQLRISEFPGENGWKMAMCVAIHELTEALLCKARGIPQEAVDAFDLGPGKNLNDPGNDPRAPYHREHTVAYVPEILLLSEFGLSANDYRGALETLNA